MLIYLCVLIVLELLQCNISSAIITDVFIPHKSGSTIHEGLMLILKRCGVQTSICYSSQCEERYQSIYDIAGPIREFHGNQLLDSINTTKVIVIRDPRDIILSEYYSYGFTHSPPNTTEEALKGFMEQRNTIQTKGINWWVVYDTKRLKSMTKSYIKALARCKSCKVLLYSWLVEQPCFYIDTITRMLGVEQFQLNVWNAWNENLRCTGKNILAEYQHVRNPKGGYFKALPRNYQKYLQVQFRPEIELLETVEAKYHAKLESFKCPWQENPCPR